MELISVILTTYNWPEALKASLKSLCEQTDTHFEIIIADDGSEQATHQVIKKFKSKCSIPIQHVFHEDEGFRAATIRNKAVAKSKGTYLVFIDGDCAVQPNFIQRHRHLAELSFFVPGNRILLSQPFSKFILESEINIHKQHIGQFLWLRLTGKINRISPLLYNPIHQLRYLFPNRWEKAMTCNLGIFKHDFFSVNGFDESFTGWGYEDSDLVIRLIHQGIKRKEGRFAAPVLHFWHQLNDRNNLNKNYQLLMKRLNDKNCKRASKGVLQYIN